MLRSLILLGVIYFGYRGVKSWISKQALFQRDYSGRDRKGIDDVMVQDPYCEVYFPMKDGVRLSIGGKDLHFCSNECKEKFLALKAKQ